MNTALTDLLELQAPLLQAPMAGVSTPALAAAVSGAGALGAIAVGAMTADAADAAIGEALRTWLSEPGRVLAHLAQPRKASYLPRVLAPLAQSIATRHQRAIHDALTHQ